MHTLVPSLRQALAELPDFRQARGRRYELLPILLLICVAMLCGYSSQSAIAQWGQNYGDHWLARLGFTAHRCPSQSTLHRIFNGIDHRRLEAILAHWAEAWLRALAGPARLQAVAVDGKTLSASHKSGSQTAHLLAGLSHQLSLVLAQVGVNDKSNEISRAADAHSVAAGRDVPGSRRYFADRLLRRKELDMTTERNLKRNGLLFGSIALSLLVSVSGVLVWGGTPAQAATQAQCRKRPVVARNAE